jgi:hypothetical protein
MCEFEFNAATCGVGIDTTNRQALSPCTYRYVYKTHTLHTLLQSERERESTHSFIVCRVFVLFGAAGESTGAIKQ